MASEREDKKGVKGKVSKRKPDYSYCSVCRRNHNDGREAHIFSERHKSGLKIILDKFNKKVKIKLIIFTAYFNKEFRFIVLGV